MTVDAAPRRAFTLPGGRGASLALRAGQTAHIVNTLGYQVVDTWALSQDGETALSMSHSRLAIGRLRPRTGDTLVDDRRVPMLTLVADDSGGVHDMLIPACDAQRYRSLGFVGWHASCAENYRHAVADIGIHAADGLNSAEARVPDPLNLFMAVETSVDGNLTLTSSVAGPGSRVVLQAQQNLILVVSACPQDIVPINGAGGPPRSVDLYVESAQTDHGVDK
jgi:uncharacterized protein YcgI (DUF1989 family)